MISNFQDVIQFDLKTLVIFDDCTTLGNVSLQLFEAIILLVLNAKIKNSYWPTVS